jgi:hypothetical protein
MLRRVLKKFEVDNGVILQPNEIVDASGFKNLKYLESTKKLGPTEAAKATVDISAPAVEASPTPAKKNRPVKPKRSVLASRPREFTRRLSRENNYGN